MENLKNYSLDFQEYKTVQSYAETLQRKVKNCFDLRLNYVNLPIKEISHIAMKLSGVDGFT